jgi:DNA gyrase subunit A
MGRSAGGVIGIRIARQGDLVVAAAIVEPGADLLVLTETGFGKRVPVQAFSRKHRGTQGVRLIPLEGRKTGPVVAVRQVSEADEEVILISAEGQVVRTKLESIATRNDGSSQGVRVMTLREGDKVAGIAAFRTGLAQRDAGGESDEAPARVAPAPRAKAARLAPAVKGARKAAPKSASKPPKTTVPKGKGKPASKVKAKTKPTKRR